MYACCVGALASFVIGTICTAIAAFILARR